MGVLIPLFRTKDPETERQLDNEEKLRVKLVQNSIEALKKEEKAVEIEISDKCKDEIERLNFIDRKLRDLEKELEDICLGRYRSGVGSR
jgi:DNA-directed RNA polymerase subunit E'/Rpb7